LVPLRGAPTMNIGQTICLGIVMHLGFLFSFLEFYGIFSKYLQEMSIGLAPD